MAHCYRCGAYMPPEAPHYRREVHIGTSIGSFFYGRRIGMSGFNRSGVRTVCADCAKDVDRSNTIGCLVPLVLAAVAAVVICTSQTHQRPATAASVLPKGMVTEVVVTVPSARIRRSPNTDADVVSGASQGDTLIVLGVYDSWFRVATAKSPTEPVGYVHRSLVTR
jgi:hypothetical protein